MSTLPGYTQDDLLRLSRRGLSFALAVVLLLGVPALVTLAAPESAGAESARWVFRLLPVIIIVGVAALRSHPNPKGLTSALVRLVRTDELRIQSLNEACRDGLVCVLAAQPIFLVVASYGVVASPSAFMAASTAMCGAAAVLVSLLVRDR